MRVLCVHTVLFLLTLSGLIRASAAASTNAPSVNPLGDSPAPSQAPQKQTANPYDKFDAPTDATNAPPAFDPDKYLTEKLHPTTPATNSTPPGQNPFAEFEPSQAQELSRLRLQKLENLPVNLELKGYEQLNGEYLFQIYIKDVPISEQPSLKKTGDDLGYRGYIVGAFHQNFVSQEDLVTHLTGTVDKSTLDLDNPTTGQKITLTFRSSESYSSDSPVDFVLLIPSQEKNVIKVQRGQTFTLPQTNTNYELIEAKDTGAAICNMMTQEHIFVPALGTSEHLASENKENDGLGTVVDDDEVAKKEAGNALSVSNPPQQVYAWTYEKDGHAYQSNAIGAYSMGLDYQLGMDGLSKDAKQALIWYLRGAMQGDPQAQDSLGEVFENGGFSHENQQTGYLVCDNSVVKDDLLSFHWYQLAFQNYRAAAEKGDGSVMGNLVLGYVADMYAEGHGVRKNGAEAVKWYRRAYEQGKISSPASALACLYDNGDCVPKNDIEALAWAYLAKASGDSFMANYLENKLGPQNSLIAQQRSKELQAELDKEKEAQSNEPKSPFGDTPLDNVQNQPKASGSGVFISADGLFLTAAHVIENSTFLRVVTQKGAIKATIVQVDRANDVALLKCEGTFVPVQIKSSSSLKLGQTVFTLGFPDIQIQGFSPKMTKGEISSLLGVQDDPRQWQISVPVQPGNSGGPLFDEQSNLVGLIEAKLDAVAMAKETGDVPQNVNYALKSAYLMPMLDPYTSELPKAGVPPAVPQKIEDVVSQATPSIGLVLVY